MVNESSRVTSDFWDSVYQAVSAWSRWLLPIRGSRRGGEGATQRGDQAEVAFALIGRCLVCHEC
jgi:hypothetical protein